MAELALPNPTFVTLGPEGTCHENATKRFIEFQELSGTASLELVDNLENEGIDRVRNGPNTFLVQNSAHPNVDLATERYPQEVFVVGSFIEPTRHLALIARRGIDNPRTLGLVKATRGYPDNLEGWDIVDISTKPEVARKLLAEEEFDAGLTSLECAREYSDDFDILQDIGPIPTAWVIYGSRPRYAGKVIAEYMPDYFTGQPEA